jgi:hypothetical protein
MADYRGPPWTHTGVSRTNMAPDAHGRTGRVDLGDWGSQVRVLSPRPFTNLTSFPAAFLVLTILTAMAEMERELVRERVRAGMARAHGKPGAAGQRASEVAPGAGRPGGRAREPR